MKQITKIKKENLYLFDKYEESWEEEWWDMPEFIQEDLSSEYKIIVHFKNSKDMSEFSNLINQTITPKTQSIWYPKAEIDRYINKRYINKNNES